MTTETDHKPESWFHEIGSDACPHGAEPDDDTPEWDTWYEATSSRHTGSQQDVRICLDAPAGEACGDCSDDSGQMVPWTACRTRSHRKPKDGVVPNPDAAHQPVVVLVGTEECLDRECDEYFTDDGDLDPGVERCSHIGTELACSCQQQANGEYGDEPCTAP